MAQINPHDEDVNSLDNSQPSKWLGMSVAVFNNLFTEPLDKSSWSTTAISILSTPIRKINPKHLLLRFLTTINSL